MGHENHLPQPPPLLESANAAMAKALATARQVAASDVPVLLSGESGTGKHVLAAAIHEWSARGAAPFVTVRRTVLSAPRHEGELFPCFGSSRDDHRWIEAADAGTLFFEEVSDLAPAQQAKLIQLLDEGQFGGGEGESVEADIRVIAATVRDLDAECRAERFRADLFFHLSTVHIQLPPLRERADDLGRLTDYLLARLTARYHRGALRVAPAMRQVFARYSWPGNIRELESIIERGVALSRSDTITTDDLPERLLGRPKKAVREPSSHPLSLQDVERHYIEDAIRASATLEEAATRLGIAATTLWRKRKRYGLR
jgi:NtrC-family two-component system response regulator AlgB